MSERHARGVVRKLLPHEGGELLRHFLRLDDESRRARFHHAVSDDFLAAYTRYAVADGSVLYGWFCDGVLRAVGELHPLGGWKRAEAAFSVEPEHLECGVGWRLMDAIVTAARNRGVETLSVCWQQENRRMQALARKGAARLRFEADEVFGEIRPRRATGLSYLREAIGEMRLLADAIIRPRAFSD
jgi:GNAT superfamily N-acetyltransferase